MSHRFTVIFEKEDEDGYHVFCPTLPGCHTQSETIEEGVENIREAIELYVGSLVEDGLPIPTEDILINPLRLRFESEATCRLSEGIGPGRRATGLRIPATERQSCNLRAELPTRREL